jgi:hypothetical protein
LCPEPTETLKPVTLAPCTIREGFENLTLQDQAAIVFGCKLADTELQVRLRDRGDKLAAHIKACE